MRVKAVDYIEHLRILRCHFRQVRCGSAADNQDVDFVLPCFDVCYIYNCCAFRKNFYGRGIAAGKYRNELLVVIVFDGALHAAAEISIAENSDSDHCCPLFFVAVIYATVYYVCRKFFRYFRYFFTKITYLQSLRICIRMLRLPHQPKVLR